MQSTCRNMFAMVGVLLGIGNALLGTELLFAQHETVCVTDAEPVPAPVREVTFDRFDGLPPATYSSYLDQQDQYLRPYGQSLEVDLKEVPADFLTQAGGRLHRQNIEKFLLAQTGSGLLDAKLIKRQPENGRAVESPKFPLDGEGTSEFSIRFTIVEKAGATETFEATYGKAATPSRIALETTFIPHGEAAKNAPKIIPPLDQTSYSRSSMRSISRKSSKMIYPEHIPRKAIDYAAAWHRGLSAAIDRQAANTSVQRP